MKLLSGLSEGQVLPRRGARGASAVLRGAASAAGPVTATLRRGRDAFPGWEARPVGRSSGGTFEARLAGLPAGGPYRLELRAGMEACRLRAFFVGDVWLLAGQSNMAGCGAIGGAARPHPRIRAFSMRREWRAATEPLHVPEESPDACHGPAQCSAAEGEALRRGARRGTGPGLFFAREMLARSGVPQGVICAAHGGTWMRQWDPARGLDDGGETLYGALLRSVRATGQPVTGLLWYQGESDATPADASAHAGRTKRLLAAVRRDLRQPRLPCVVVQLARVFGRSGKDQIAAWNRIQEQQRRLPAAVERLETVAAIDLPLDDPIHLGAAAFPRLAARLAQAADRLAYGNRREPPAPRLASVRGPAPEPGGRHLVLSVRFRHVPGGLRSAGEPRGFSVVDRQGRDARLLFKTVLRGDVALLHVRAPLPPGLSLWYGHDLVPACNVTDGRDMALPVFGPLPIGAASFPAP